MKSNFKNNEINLFKHNSNLTLPNSIEIEQLILGYLITDKTIRQFILTKLNIHDFYQYEHKEIFTAIIDILLNKTQLNIITISEHLEIKNKLNNIGGISYLKNLTSNISKKNNITALIKILKQKSILREIVIIATNLKEYCYKNFPENKSITEIIYNAIQQLQTLTKQKNINPIKNEPTSITKILKKTILSIDESTKTNNYITGLQTGFKEFDELTSGLQKSSLIIIAGRPSMGKTTFALNIIENLLKTTFTNMIFFSMEMQAKQIIFKLLSSITAINLQNLHNGRLTENEWKKLTTIITYIKKKNLYIDDASIQTPYSIKRKIEKINKNAKKIDLIIIDYLQLMKLSNLKKETRANEISNISRSLKILAKDLDIPVIVLSQLNRNLEQRYDKRPIMADLKESGSIEQDADLIIFLYRDEIYNKNIKNKGHTEIIIGKNRNGPLGTIKLTFVGECSHFK